MPDTQFKVYLDTCVLSRIADQEFKNERVLAAFEQLCDIENITMVTSRKSLEEFINTPDRGKRVALRLIYKIIAKIPNENLVSYKPALLGTSVLGRTILGRGVRRNDPLFESLKEIFDVVDAEHVFQATKAGCDYFLTLDRRTILNRIKTRKNILHNICTNMKFVDPQELIELLKR